MLEGRANEDWQQYRTCPGFIGRQYRTLSTLPERFSMRPQNYSFGNAQVPLTFKCQRLLFWSLCTGKLLTPVGFAARIAAIVEGTRGFSIASKPSKPSNQSYTFNPAPFLPA